MINLFDEMTRDRPPITTKGRTVINIDCGGNKVIKEGVSPQELATLEQQEAAVMRLLRQKGPLNTKRLIEAIGHFAPWRVTQILHRLRDKGKVHKDPLNRYAPWSLTGKKATTPQIKAALQEKHHERQATNRNRKGAAVAAAADSGTDHGQHDGQ